MRSQPAGDSVKAGARKRKLLGVVQREYCGLSTLRAQKLARSQQHWKCAIRGKQLGAGAVECQRGMPAAGGDVEYAPGAVRKHPFTQLVEAGTGAVCGAGNIVGSVCAKLGLYNCFTHVGRFSWAALLDVKSLDSNASVRVVSSATRVALGIGR